MNIFYYPVDEKIGIKNRVKEVIEKDLRLKCGLGWKALDAFMFKLHNKDLSWLTNEINLESKRPWDKRYLAKLKDDMYEYRGKTSRQCTIRVYFCYYKDGVLLLLAESKTDSKDSIDIAVKRKDEVIGRR